MYYHNCLGATLLHFCYTVLKLYDGWRFMSRKMVSTEHDASVIHCGRKQFSGSFLPGLAPLLFTAAGISSQMVSRSAWHFCCSPTQETFHERFLIGPVASIICRSRKPVSANKKAAPEGSFFIGFILQPELLHGKELLPVRRRFFCGLHQC